MTINTQKMGFSYFSSPIFQVSQQLNTWMPALRQWGASYIIFQASFDVAVPEDAFQCAQDHGLETFVHFNSALPTAKEFNNASLLLDIYKKWGCQYVILGDQPNTKNAWPIANWLYETLVDRFLNRFIPLAYHSVRIGLNPILAPLIPGGDYWDSAFLELLLGGMTQRKMSRIINNLTLSSYGYTFYKPLSWGSGGPQQWPGSKPYETPEGQEDQVGFNNFEWVQAAGERVIGERRPVLILDAGRPSPAGDHLNTDTAVEEIKKLVTSCSNPISNEVDAKIDCPVFNEHVMGCTFSLDTLSSLMGEGFSRAALAEVFRPGKDTEEKTADIKGNQKYLAHYLLLPSYESGVSDVVLNKIRPLIKKLRPTVGFSLEEAAHAERVSIFPDPYVFNDHEINQLRSAGCEVEILPDSGIEIATILQ